MTIADLSVMEVEVEVDETDVVGVQLGQTADVRVDAFPNQVFKGKVTEIGSSALQKTALSTATTQESKDFKVVITLDNPSKLLKPGPLGLGRYHHRREEAGPGRPDLGPCPQGEEGGRRPRSNRREDKAQAKRRASTSSRPAGPNSSRSRRASWAS